MVMKKVMFIPYPVCDIIYTDKISNKGGADTMLVNYQQEIERIKQQIVDKYNPVKIVLFGSLARGNYHEESDIDLLIIQETVADRMTITSQYYKEIDYDIPTDFVITTPEGYASGNSDLTNVFAKNIQQEGIVLYER